MWYMIRTPPWYVDTTYIPGTSLLHPTLKPRHFLLRCRLQLTYRFFNTKTKISRTHCRRLLLYRLLLRYRRYSLLGGDLSIRNSLRSNYTIRVRTRCTYSGLEPLVSGAAYLVYQAGSTCSRARYQQRELLLQLERGLNRNTTCI